ncbi:DinB family protein [Blastococcus sp. CT_GayMR20]|uniref:DinB family protein n=1 Tax=Blastococcus sp. CT_GayMR20 TaxID=2559609 RepID=UPI001073A579|nr:DinB family protein [Blastococcus sp. CT_GayMR20]TFV86685.1 DinB family protein [Blastococcus sp. CT_GayMR20]
MPEQYTHTDAFRGAAFTAADLTGATFRDCDLSGVRITGSQVAGLRVSGYGGSVLVDDVDVTDFVAGELDRRHPERLQLRAMGTAEDYRAMWDTVERLWSETVARAERLPEPMRHERVRGEWSFAETLRHLAFATDGWVGRMLTDGAFVYSPLGLPPSDVSAEDAASIGLDVGVQPSYTETLALFADRRASVRRVVEGLTDNGLEEVRTAALAAPAWGVESHPVAECLRTLMDEYCEHRRFAERDLAVLEGR